MAETLYWGDLHCHTGLSYGRGTPEAALANGRAHVDFVALIGHAFWPDMGVTAADPTGWDARHLGGFERLRLLWPAARELIERENRPTKFITFLGYEWHSNAWGDYNVLYRDATAEAELAGAPDIDTLKEQARGKTAYVFPHHLGYMKAERGINWDTYTSDLSPVVEICSGHGEFEADDGGPNAVDWIPMGPRVTRGCLREGLKRGFRFGVIGSTDNHSAYPAAYNGGRAGVYASALTREAIWDALAARRTIAAKGDSIALWLEANGAPLGSEIHVPDGRVHLAFSVRGEDAIDKVELIRNEHIHRVWHPNDPPVIHQTKGSDPFVCTRFQRGSATFSGLIHNKKGSDPFFKVRLQIGWGNSPYLTDWAGVLKVRGGEVRAVRPYFQTANDQDPNDGGRQQLDSWDSHGFSFRCLALGPVQQYVAELAGAPDTQLVFESNQSAFRTSLGDLGERSIAGRERKHTSTAAKLCQAVPERAYAFAADFDDDLADLAEARYYLRVTQQNLQRAWSSPIWVRT